MTIELHVEVKKNKEKIHASSYVRSLYKIDSFILAIFNYNNNNIHDKTYNNN